MQIRISSDHSIEHKNGYWIYHAHSKSEVTGIDYKSSTKTYLKMLDMWYNIKIAGACGDRVMKAVQQLLDKQPKELR